MLHVNLQYILFYALQKYSYLRLKKIQFELIKFQFDRIRDLCHFKQDTRKELQVFYATICC